MSQNMSKLSLPYDVTEEITLFFDRKIYFHLSNSQILFFVLIMQKKNVAQYLYIMDIFLSLLQTIKRLKHFLNVQIFGFVHSILKYEN